jgi:hypothetical protein
MEYFTFKGRNNSNMLLPTVGAYFVTILFTLALSALLMWILNKIAKNILLLGLVIGVTAGIMGWCYFTVVIVEYKGEKNAETHIAFFKSEFTSSDGQTVPLTSKSGKDVFIVNETDDVLALQKIHYGATQNDAANHDISYPEILHSHSFLLARNIPDYFPWEDPLEHVLVNTSVEGDASVRSWLRMEEKGEVGK